MKRPKPTKMNPGLFAAALALALGPAVHPTGPVAKAERAPSRADRAAALKQKKKRKATSAARRRNR